MNVTRARYVARVLRQVFVAETVRSVRRGRRPGRSDDVDRNRSRARAVRHALEELGPFYIKVGQMLSTRPDMVPEYMIEEFQHLHEKVSVAPFSSFEPILEEELGRDWRRFFKEIETEVPLGAASLAQVYKVKLQTGEPAVIKVQRPGVAPIMLDDMAMLKQAAKFIAKRAPDFNEVIDLEAMLEVIFGAMEPELDFTLEAKNMDDARECLEEYDTLAVPEVVFVTKKVMVQSLAPGRSIRDADRDAFTKEEREAIGRDLLAFMYQSYFVDRMFHADPHPGNVFVAPGEPAYLIDWGMVGRMDRRMSMNLVLVILNLAQNDGVGMAKSWIEMGRATSWANIPAFMNDMASFVPTMASASLDELNFGVTLTSVLKFSTRRGIQTSPVVALLGKSFANLDGSVRYLAPELSIIDVFEEEFQDILFELVQEGLAEDQMARAALETLMGTLAAPEQLRGLIRDISNREFTLNVNEIQPKRARQEDRADARAKSMRRTLTGLGAMALWLDHKRKTGGAGR